MKTDISRVASLPITGKGKFVQIFVNGEAFIRFAPGLLCFHAMILLDFLKEADLKFELDHKDPKLKGQNYDAVGMGKYDVKDKRIILYGRSLDYSIGFHEEHFEKIKPHLPSELNFKGVK